MSQAEAYWIEVQALKVGGQEFAVFVDAQGNFSALLEDERLCRPSRAELAKLLQATLRRRHARVELPFVYSQGKSDCRRVVVTGIHATRDTLLVRWPDSGKTGELEAYCLLRDMTDAELTTLRGLMQAYRRAADELVDFRKTLTVDARKLVEEAIAQASAS